jgi:hypothetical protein
MRPDESVLDDGGKKIKFTNKDKKEDYLLLLSS